LDPMATGVLVVGVGSGTKKLSELIDGTKEYMATCVFGAMTDSYDAVGKIVRQTTTDHITREKVEEILPQFRGNYLQTPPM
jgi:tRNA pseudouridine55 synthase